MGKLNEALQLLAHLGIAHGDAPTKQAHGGKNGKATKRGPGRYAVGGEPGTRIAKQRPQRAYAALMAAWASKRVTNWNGFADKHGACTFVGQPRRVWLAGISAQRGY